MSGFLGHPPKKNMIRPTESVSWILKSIFFLLRNKNQMNAANLTAKRIYLGSILLVTHRKNGRAIKRPLRNEEIIL